MPKLLSPCVDVCKYKLKGHCIACSMTKPQKSGYKSLSSQADQRAFFDMLLAQQKLLGKFKAWPGMYARRCKKKGVKNPLV